MTGEDKFLESVNSTNFKNTKSEKAVSSDFWCFITVIPVKMGLRTFAILQFIGDVFFGVLNLFLFALASILLSVSFGCVLYSFPGRVLCAWKCLVASADYHSHLWNKVPSSNKDQRARQKENDSISSRCLQLLSHFTLAMERIYLWNCCHFLD